MHDNIKTPVFRIIALIMGWQHIKVIPGRDANLPDGCGFVAATVPDKNVIPHFGWQGKPPGTMRISENNFL